MPKNKKRVQEDFPFKSTSVIKNMEDIYTVINYVQMSRKEFSFIVQSEDIVTIEHIFKDCEISYTSDQHPKGIRYHLVPPPERDVLKEAYFIDEDYDDEIIEDGQCF